MARRSVSRCSGCGHEEPRWVGRCPSCGAWGTMGEEEIVTRRGSTDESRAAPAAALPIGEVPPGHVRRIATGIGELDRVLGGGIVPGSVVLLAGEPGIGKSTLLLQASQAVASAGSTVLYVSGEESAAQVRLRGERVGAMDTRILVAAETSATRISQLVERHAPAVAVIDSIQTADDPAVDSAPGSTSQVRAVASLLAQDAKRTGTAVILVGHVTKDGAVAGPKTLEHLVDAVAIFDGEREQSLRLLRSVKNRFGPAGEVGCFEIVEEGLREVADAGELFTTAHAEDVTGVASTVMLEGPRPLVVEVQTLAASSDLKVARRHASGIDPARLAVLVAVVEQRAGVALSRHDLFASAVGGVKIREPGADLALALALASTRRDLPIPTDLVAVGEVGLAGELRTVPRLDRRLAEAARRGFVRALVPAGYDGPGHGLEVTRLPDIAAAVTAGLRSPARLVHAG